MNKNLLIFLVHEITGVQETNIIRYNSIEYEDNKIILIYTYNKETHNHPNTLDINKSYFLIENKELEIFNKYKIIDWFYINHGEMIKVILISK